MSVTYQVVNWKRTRKSNERRFVSCPVMLQDVNLCENLFSGNFTLHLVLPYLVKVDMSGNSIGPNIEVENLSPSTLVDLRRNQISTAMIKCAKQVMLFPQNQHPLGIL